TDLTGLSSGSFFPVGLHELKYRVVTISNQSDSCSFTITVIDNEIPVISCPTDIHVIADSNDCDPQIFWTEPVPTDNCGIATFTSNFNSGDRFYLGTYTVTYDVEDIHGNTNTCSFGIEVESTPLT